MSYRNLMKATLVGLAVTLVTAGSALAADCGCGKCGNGCNCGGSGSCSMPKTSN